VSWFEEDRVTDEKGPAVARLVDRKLKPVT
jgi:hypothetical protein